MNINDECAVVSTLVNMLKADSSREYCAIGTSIIFKQEVALNISILNACFPESFGCSYQKYSYTIPASPIIALFSLCQKSDTVPTIIHTHAPDLHSQGKVFFSEQDHCYFLKLSSIARNEWNLPFLFTIVTNGIYTKYCLYNTETFKANLWEEKL